MNKYEQNSVNRMVRQVQEMKESNKDHWKESFFETDKRLDINKKAEDC